MVSIGRTLVTPNQLEQLLVREDLVRVAHEGGEEPELERRQGNLLTSRLNGALREVDHYEAVRVALRGLLPRPAAAQPRIDPRQELLTAEGLRDVVVRAGAKAPDLVELLGAGGQHQHRDVAQLPDALEHLPPVQARHRDV